MSHTSGQLREVLGLPEPPKSSAVPAGGVRTNAGGPVRGSGSADGGKRGSVALSQKAVPPPEKWVPRVWTAR